MEKIDYINLDNSYMSSYIKHNSFIKRGNPSMDLLYSNIMMDVDLVLTTLNVSPKKNGYRYWKDAVFIYMLNNHPQISICKEVYPAIGEKYGKTPMSVERAMRICFENAMYFVSKREKNYITEFMKCTLLYPHNSEILCRITELVSSSIFQKEKQKSFQFAYQS